MAGSSSSINPLYANAVTEKLSRSNHSMWKAQILAALRGARLVGHVTGATTAPAAEIDGTGADGKKAMVSNPAYEEWYATDQQVLGFLLSSLSKEILAQAASKETAATAWREIEGMFTSQTRARTVNTRLALATTQKGAMSVAEYVGKMKALGDEMAAAGRPLDEEELVEYILTGLDFDFNPIVSAIIARTDPVSIGELYSQLLSFETRQALLSSGGGGGSSANAAGRGRGRPSRGGFGRGPGGPPRDQGRGRTDGAGNSTNNRPIYKRNSNNGTSGNGNTVDKRPLCQVCKKKGHTADRCWHRFDEDYVPDERSAAAATGSYGVDHIWYADSGSTDHITADLNKLAVRDKYSGNDQVQAANGAGPGHEEHSS